MEKATKTDVHLCNRPESEKPSLTFELVSQYFCVPITQAAREFNMGQTAFKKRCRELGIQRWPGRKFRSLQKVTRDVKVLRNKGAVQRPTLTFELVSQFFCMPIHQAARELNVGESTLKKRCRELGIPQWPARKVKCLQNLIDDVKELGKDDTPEEAERTKMAVQMLQERKRLVEERPDVELDNHTKEFRKGVCMEKFKIRRRKERTLHA